MKYRSEIDGLRAFAVIPVIFFHAGFSFFSGGFVGVDVFFVISGYLITTILIEEMSDSKFSIVNFYERRARRILPVLFFVVVVCLPFAWMWMLPGQLKDFSKSLIAVSLFLSNVLFWRESGYFSAASEEKPLLHTWTLSVEEQYYVLFPLFLLMSWRFGKKKVFWAIFIMAAFSLFLSEWGWRNKPTANFYLAPTRAWELFLGSISAFLISNKTVIKNDFFSLSGLSLVLFSILAYDESIPFPSMYTLVPVIGTILIILYGQDGTITSKILSFKLFVGIGLISYSAYLWHQPIIAFIKIKYTDEPSNLTALAIVLGTFIISYLSWTYIETPFRNKNLISRRAIFIFSTSGLFLLSIIGYIGYIEKGFVNRVTVENNDHLLKEISKKWDFSDYPNHHLINRSDFGYNSIGDTNLNNESIILIGDSHAYQYWYSLANLVQSNPKNFESINILLLNKKLLELSARDIFIPNKTKRVVLSYFWSLHLNNPSVNTYIRCCGNGPGGVVGKYYEKIPDVELENHFSILENFIVNLKNSGIDVVLVLDNPFGEELNPKSLLNVEREGGLHLTSNDHTLIELTTAEANKRRQPTNDKLLQLAKKLKLDIIDPYLYLCDLNFCSKFDSKTGHFRYKDYDHLSFDTIKNETKYIHRVLN